jgi:hypothetical protein
MKSYEDRANEFLNTHCGELADYIDEEEWLSIFAALAQEFEEVAEEGRQ